MARAYDIHVEQLLDRVHQFHSLLTDAGIAYRIVGGVAVYMHVYERDPLAARLTSDVDAAINRSDLPAVIEAARKAGLVYRPVAGVDMLVDEAQPRTRSAVHLFFSDENAHSQNTSEGIWVAAVEDLLHMKLTSYRLKDRVHIQDMDGVGLITSQLESRLPEPLAVRLAEIRATE